MLNFISSYNHVWCNITKDSALTKKFDRYAAYQNGIISFNDLLDEAAEVMYDIQKPLWRSTNDLAEDIIVTLYDCGDPSKTFTYRYLNKYHIDPKPIGALLMAMAYIISYNMNKDDYALLTAIGNIFRNVSDKHMVG